MLFKRISLIRRLTSQGSDLARSRYLAADPNVYVKHAATPLRLAANTECPSAASFYGHACVCRPLPRWT